MSEIWKDVANYDGMYQISSLGRFKSFKRYNNGKILIGGKDTKGYKNVGLNLNGISKIVNTHKLVAMAFLGHKPDGTNKLVVDHINNDKLDNRVENLQIITNRENASKDRKNGTSKYTGVSWSKTYNKWVSNIQINNKKISLGLFNTQEEAHEIYQLKLKTIKL